MAGDGEGQVAAREVEDAGHGRHEHPRVVVAAEAPVHRREERRGVGLARGHGLEDRLRPGHEQRGGDALARHVADQEEDPPSVAEVVEEVSAHQARGHEGRPELEPLVTPPGHGPRQHVRLDAAGDLQLALQPLLRRGRFLEVPDVLLEGIAHVEEGAGERSHLVARLDGRQRRVEIPPGDLVGARGQGPERARQPAGQHHDHEDQQEETAESEEPLHDPQPADLGEELLLGVEGRERPPRPAERPVGEAKRHSLDLDPREALLPGHHLLHDRLEPGPVPRARLLEDGPRGGRGPPLRGRDDDPRPREHEPEAALAQLDLLDDRVEPLQPHVGGHDPGRRSAGPAEGDGERDHRGVPSALVPVGLRPEGPSRRERALEPGPLPVAVGLGREVGGQEAALTLGGPVVVQGTALSPRARHPGDRRPVEVAIALDEAPQQRVDVGVAGAEDGERLAERERPLLDRVQQVLDPAHRGLGLVDRLALGRRHRHAARQGVRHRDRGDVDAAHREQGPHDEAGGQAAEPAGRGAGVCHGVAGAPPV